MLTIEPSIEQQGRPIGLHEGESPKPRLVPIAATVQEAIFVHPFAEQMPIRQSGLLLGMLLLQLFLQEFFENYSRHPTVRQDG